MRHLCFTEKVHTTYKVAILIKDAALKLKGLMEYYVDPLSKAGVHPDDLIALSLTYDDKGKAPAAMIKDCLQNVLKTCTHMGITTLLVADGAYFKKLIKDTKAEVHAGYVKPCKIEGYEHINVILSANYQGIYFNPAVEDKLRISNAALATHLNGTYAAPGTGIIHTASYPKTLNEIKDTLNKLLTYPALTCDTEDYGLALSPLGTIAFAWDKHNGVAFQMQPNHDARLFTSSVHSLIHKFFEIYKGRVIYHNATFDIKQLIFNLYMKGVYSDYKNTIAGLKTMFRCIHDTMMLVYLATNSTVRPELGLKPNSAEFAGNYAKEDIKDISLIPFPELKEYNLTDCLATWDVFNKNYPVVVKDQQLNVYNTIVIPSLRVITNMELVGMPLDMESVDVAEEALQKIADENNEFLHNSPEIKQWEFKRMINLFNKRTAEMKRNINPMENYHEDFNPGSFEQIGELLHEQIGLEPIDRTKTKAPATGSKSLMKLANQLISKFELPQELYDIR